LNPPDGEKLPGDGRTARDDRFRVSGAGGPPDRTPPKLTFDSPLLHCFFITNPEVSMGQSQEEKMAVLVEKDPEFKALVQEHRSLDEKLKDLDRKVYLTPDEEVERKRLQKLKLAKKDKIAQMLAGQ